MLLLPRSIFDHVAALISSVFLCLLASLFPPAAFAQVATGSPPFGSFSGGPDVINLSDLNAHVSIPVLHKAGRGTNFTYDLSYDTSVWYPVTSGSTTSWQPVVNWGWRGVTEVATGYLSFSSTTIPWCLYNGQYIGTETIRSNWVYHDALGSTHPFGGSDYTYTGVPGHCSDSSTPLNATAVDGSGIKLAAGGSVGTMTYPNGQIVMAPINTTSGSATMTDRNGNKLTADTSGNFYDTLSSTIPVLTVSGSGTPSSPTKFTYSAPSGSSVYYQMNYTNYTVATNFGVGSIGEFRSTAAVPLVTSITLPDGSIYSFAYEVTPGSCTPYSGTTCTTARLVSTTLPTGGQISYVYYNNGGNFPSCTTGNNGIFSDGSASCLKRTTPDGTWTYTQSKGAGAASTTTQTDPLSNVTTIQFQGIYETQRVQGSGTTLQTVNTCYNGASSPCTSTAIALPITQRSAIGNAPGSTLQSKRVDSWDSLGNPTESDEYDFGSGAPPSTPLRKTLITYAVLGNNINAFSQTVTVCSLIGTASACGGTGTVVSQTTNSYDQTSVSAPTGTTPQHVSVTGSRGNLTTVTYLTSGTATLSKTFTYYDTGTLKTTVDVNGSSSTVTYNYPDATSTCGNAFPTSILEPLSLSRSMTWNCTGGVQITSVDENNRTTSATFNDPYFWRPAKVDFPDSGETSWAYNSPAQLTTTTKMNSTKNIVSVAILDSLGRAKQGQLASDPLGTVYQDTTYDSLGRIASVSNPYRTLTDPTYGLTAYQYDSLGRITKVIPPDGSGSSNNTSIAYSTNCVTVTDPAAKATSSCFDALGRTTIAGEDPAGANYQTVYSWDVLGNLLSVTQKGGSTNSSQWRVRNFTYDFLSRLTQSSTPEAGTVSYKYDADSACGSPNSFPGQLISRTDARGIRTCTQYDALNRLTNKAYSDGTPSAFYTYDISTKYGIQFQNPLGRMVLAERPCSTLSFSYDSVGRIISNLQDTYLSCTNGAETLTLNYTYDLAGNMTSYTNGTYTFTQTFDTAGRPTAVTSNLVDSQHPANLFTADPTAGYFANGAVRKATLANGLTQSAMYNNRFQPCRVGLNSSGASFAGCADAVPSGNVLDLSYGFNVGTSNNGNVGSSSAIGSQTFTRSYGYDTLNRLSTMSDTAASQACKGLSWTVDPWSNLTDQTQTSGTCLTLHVGVGTNNRLTSPYLYDAAGNMTSDGTHTYAYDAENRLISVDSGNTATYIYDALGRRSIKLPPSGAWTQYFYDLNNNDVTEFGEGCGPNCWARGYVYFADRPFAEYFNGTTYSIHPDHLGSTRLLTGLNQAPVQNLDYLPFGIRNSSDSDISSREFTGDELDFETGLNHTLFRKYSSNLARWTTPDPGDLSTASISNPQSWNRYGYVVNNPLSLIDPLGLDSVNPLQKPKRKGHPRYPPRHAIDCLYGQTSMFGGGGCTDNSDPFWALYLILPNGFSLEGTPTFPYVGLFYSSLFFPGPANGSFTGGKYLRPRTDKEYKACLGEADAQGAKKLWAATGEQLLGGALTEVGAYTAWKTVPTLNKSFFEGPMEIIDFFKGGAFNYAGTTSTLGPGLYMFGKGTFDAAKAYDDFNRAAASCGGPVPVSN